MKRRSFLPLLTLGIAIPLLIAAYFVTDGELRGAYEGIFLLKGDTPYSFRLTDDVYHGEQEKVLLSIPLRGHSAAFAIPSSHAGGTTVLSCEWNEVTGRGCITSNHPNGTKLVSCFGRFIDGNGEAPAGLFLGGNLPFTVKVGARTAPNASGMSFYDGARWNHIWCSVNEAFLTNEPHPLNIGPAKMKFLGGKVLRKTESQVILMSRHEIPLRNTTLLMDRYVFFESGDIHYVMVNKVTNTGTNEANFSYVYGDEPWVGNYGSSRGDVGWLQDRVVNHEGAFDTRSNSFAGMFDYGNPVMNEGHNYTWAANFIEWLGEPPTVGFFSNKPGYFEEHRQPLASDTRFIGLQWGPELLAPGESKTYIMAIGMAGRDAMSGFPVKPRVDFPYETYREIVQ